MIDYVKAPGPKNITRYNELRSEFQAIVRKLSARVSRSGRK